MKSIPLKIIIAALPILFFLFPVNMTGCTDQFFSMMDSENSYGYHHYNAPAIDENYFPNTEYEDTLGADGVVDLNKSIATKERYWTSTGFVYYGIQTYYAITFDDGFSNAKGNTDEFYVRCVSDLSGSTTDTTYFPVPDTGQDTGYTDVFGEDNDYLTPASMKYTDNADGTVHDDVTGLTWTKCTLGTGADTSTDCSGYHRKYNHADAVTACSGLTLAGKTWKLPSLPEILSIVHYGKKTVYYYE